MDEILADVEGYKGNPSYSVFYSVFYAVGSFCSPQRFNCMWEEKHFPGQLERYLCPRQMRYDLR